MKTTVKLKYIRQSAKKIRFVLDGVRGLQVPNALNKLDYSNKKAGKFISKGIRSGISNLSSLGEDGFDGSDGTDGENAPKHAGSPALQAMDTR